MGFKEDIQKLSIQISERKNHVTNEEMAKQTLIIPFLQVLGFDVFNPLEVRPEYTADFGKAKKAKVDYAICKDNNPIIFIEAKALNERIENHDSQLAMYFNSTPSVKLAIITNGVEYRFFTDLKNTNVMDNLPFFIVDNISCLSDSDIDLISIFRKNEYKKDSMLAIAEELNYAARLNKAVEDLFKNPTDDFIRFLIKPIKGGAITGTVIEKFRPMVKKSISSVFLKMVSEGLYPKEGELDKPIVEDNYQSTVVKQNVCPTEDDVSGFNIICDILNSVARNISELNLTKTNNHLSIHNRNKLKWIFRLSLDGSKKSLICKLPVDKAVKLAPDFIVEDSPKGGSRILINSPDDLYRLNRLIVKCYDEGAN